MAINGDTNITGFVNLLKVGRKEDLGYLADCWT
jgi:hypothetical protein